MSVLASDMRAIGITNPDEKLLFRLAQIIALCEESYDFSQDLVWQCMDDLQVFIKSVPRPKDLPYEEHYPASPELLRAELRKHACGNAPLPASVDMPELAAVLGSAKMRGRPNPKGSAPRKAPKWMNAVPPEHRSAVMDALKSSTSGGSKATLPVIPVAPGASTTPTHQTPVFTTDAFRFQAPPKIEPASEKKRDREAAPDDAETENESENSDSDSESEVDPKTISAIEHKMLAARGKARAEKKRQPR